MKKVALVYHSAHGHTAHIAHRVADAIGAAGPIEVRLLEAAIAAAAPEALVGFDGFVFGSPTYLGGVSGPFKSFMDSTGRLWREQRLKGRLAAGFTVSSLPAGDKQSTLLSMFVFAMQHGLIWVGNPVLPEQHQGVPYEQAANRLGSWSGLMAQAEHGRPADAFPPGDLRGAALFGQAFAATLLRLGSSPGQANRGPAVDPCRLQA